jgi:subtilisin family serine protease
MIEGLAELLSRTRGDPRVLVAILDGAVDFAHPALTAGNFVQLPTLTTDRPTRHGTHVASVAVGQGLGIAPACRGVSIPVFQESAEGELQACSQLDLARAIRQAVDAGAQVINVSGGQLASGGKAEPFLAEAVHYCAAQGALIVAAAGNEGCECLYVPAALPAVLAVGAMGADGRPLDFSNWGYGGQGLLAPGENVLGAAPGGGTALRSGTSFATPIVSGIIALLLSRQLERGEAANPRAVRDALLASARACQPGEAPDCARYLAGRLDLPGARRILERPPPQSSSQASSIPQGGSTQVSETQDSVHLAQSSAECGCGGGKSAPCGCSGRLAYAIGQLGYDLVSEARRDSIAQSMAGKNVHVPADLLAHLEANPWEAEAFVWTLNIDATPIYAVRPAGPFAGVAFERLREFLAGQLNEGVERISVPGRISGRATLFSGQVVPVITPELRGMYSWSTDALITAVLGPPPAGGGAEAETYAKASDGIRNFIGRVYYALRNLGQSPEERAINFAATQAFQVARSFQDAVDKGLVLDTTEVERSPICRPGSECWDVKITFFNPSERLTQSRHVHRFTVDVSDVIPVTVGPVRSWAVY